MKHQFDVVMAWSVSITSAAYCKTWSCSWARCTRRGLTFPLHLARAKSEGKRLGRPPIAVALEHRIRDALNAPGRSEGVRKIAARYTGRDGQ
jgi:hypothetical protein